MNAPIASPLGLARAQSSDVPFLTGAQRREQFRLEISQLDEAEVLELLGWLLDTGINDPCPDMSDDFSDALAPLSEAYRQSYDTLSAIACPERAPVYPERPCAAVFGSYRR